jgi:GTP cyclohydrolase I
VVGLSRLSHLVDCFARRLVLQETLTLQIPQALMEHLRSPGAACVLTSRQGCMALRGARQEHARATTAAWLGTFESDANLRGLFLKAIPPAE